MEVVLNKLYKSDVIITEARCLNSKKEAHYEQPIEWGAALMRQRIRNTPEWAIHEGISEQPLS